MDGRRISRNDGRAAKSSSCSAPTTGEVPREWLDSHRPRPRREIRPARSPYLHELRAGWNLIDVKIASGQSRFAFACQINATDDLRFEAVQPAG